MIHRPIYIFNVLNPILLLLFVGSLSPLRLNPGLGPWDFNLGAYLIQYSKLVICSLLGFCGDTCRRIPRMLQRLSRLLIHLRPFQYPLRRTSTMTSLPDRTISTAGCLIIGDEILNSKTMDTNSAHFGRPSQSSVF